jgi:hypothetical protein
LGVSLITLILHLSSNPASGFNITFISFGLGLMCGIPLVFLMPAGKQKSSESFSARLDAHAARDCTSQPPFQRPSSRTM